MYIRQAQTNEISKIEDIYKKAKAFMRQNGNLSQWQKDYPSITDIENDIESDNLYVCVENDCVVGVFAFIIGDDPTYKEIKGSWHFEAKYGVIHRLASNGMEKGIAKACFDFCASKCAYLRIDTHKDNIPMQNAIRRYGFTECGIVHIKDGTERIAYDKVASITSCF